jgi:uncharacterized phage infection (PIP) family protein YhgE
MPNVDITIRTIDQSEKGTQRAVGSLTDLASAISLVEQGFSIAQGVFNETVGKLDEYASQVEKVSRLTGENAEESSKLIQVADDLFISYESLSSALAIASRRTDTSIEGIAKLSDQYLALETATERNAFAAETFGRNYTEVIKLLEAGGDTIRQMANETPEGLILNEQDIDQIRAYRREVDKARDSWDAFLLTVGGEVIGKFSEMNIQIEATRILAEQAGVQILSQRDAQRLWAESSEEARTAAMELAEAQYYQSDAMTEAQEQAKELEENLKALSEANQELFGLMGDFNDIADGYNEKMDNLKEQEQELLEKKTALVNQGYLPESDAIQDINERLADNAQAQLDAAAAAEESSKRRIIALLETKFMSDQVLTDTEFNALIALEKQWGLMSDEAATAAQQVNEAVNTYLDTGNLDDFTSSVDSITDALLRLPEEKEININANLTINGQPASAQELFGLVEIEEV